MDKVPMTVAGVHPEAGPSRSRVSAALHPLGVLQKQRGVWRSSWGRKDTSQLWSCLLRGPPLQAPEVRPGRDHSEARRFPEARGGGAAPGIPAEPTLQLPPSPPSSRRPSLRAAAASSRGGWDPRAREVRAPPGWRGEGSGRLEAYRPRLLDPRHAGCGGARRAGLGARLLGAQTRTHGRRRRHCCRAPGKEV